MSINESERRLRPKKPEKGLDPPLPPPKKLEKGLPPPPNPPNIPAVVIAAVEVPNVGNNVEYVPGVLYVLYRVVVPEYISIDSFEIQRFLNSELSY